MSYAKIIKTVTSHLTAHGLPMDPIGWSKAVVDRIAVGGPGVEHVERLRPLPLLLSEGERIRCAWGVDRVTGELRPSIEALSTMTPKLREHLGDGARAVLAFSPEYAPAVLAKLSGDEALAADAGAGVAMIALAQASGDRLSIGEAPRAFNAWRLGNTGHGVEVVGEVFAKLYPKAATWLGDHRDALTREVNASTIRGCYAGLSAPGELVAVLGGVAFVMSPATAQDVSEARAGWTRALGAGAPGLTVKVGVRIGWSVGKLGELPGGELPEDWSMGAPCPLPMVRGRAGRVLEILGAIRDGLQAQAIESSPALLYGLQLATLDAPDDLRAAAAPYPEIRASVRAAKAAALALVTPRVQAEAAGEVCLERGDHDEGASEMLKWYEAQGYQLLTLGDKLFTSTGAAWREVSVAERAENVREALRGAQVLTDKGSRPLMLNQSFVEGVDCAVIQRVTAQAIHEQTGHGAAAAFDRPSPGVPLRDGLLSEDGLIRPITADDRILASTVLDLGYDPGATCPRWLRFLREVWSDAPDVHERIAFLREWLGAALFGVATKRRGFPLLIGMRRCGKSTLIEVVKSLFPETAISAVTMDRLNGQDAQKSVHSLFGKRLNAVTEHPAGHLPDAAIFKQVVVGESVAAKSLYKDEYTFRPSAAWILAMNDLPTLTDTSGAAMDRIVPLTFSRQFDEDETLAPALAAERMGIILWAVEGLRSLKGRSAYTAVPSAWQARTDWHAASDSVAAYVAENMRGTEEEPAHAVKVLCSTLYGHYAEWCKEGGYKNPVNAASFGKRLRALEPSWQSVTARHNNAVVRVIEVTHLHLSTPSGL